MIDLGERLSIQMFAITALCSVGFIVLWTTLRSLTHKVDRVIEHQRAQQEALAREEGGATFIAGDEDWMRMRMRMMQDGSDDDDQEGPEMQLEGGGPVQQTTAPPENKLRLVIPDQSDAEEIHPLIIPHPSPPSPLGG